VASTIAKGLVDGDAVTTTVLLCTLFAAVVWGLFTWLLGLPSSSSHALVGGLCGATIAGSGGNAWEPPSG
jgi:PiT family inorganic phosphate transporter